MPVRPAIALNRITEIGGDHMYSKQFNKSYGPFKAVDAECIKHHSHACKSGGGNVKTGDIRNERNGIQVVLINSPVHIHVDVDEDEDEDEDDD